MTRLQTWNKNIVSSDLVYKLNPKNIHDLTRFENVVLKSCINSSIQDQKDIIFGLVALELLTNQKAKVSRTRKSIAAFKTRKFMPISTKVTLRKKNLYNYLDFFICIVLPRLPQLKEFEKNSVIKAKTSLSIGLPNLTIFPQLTKESEQLPKNMGLTLTINSNNIHSNTSLLLFLSEFQMPVIL